MTDTIQRVVGIDASWTGCSISRIERCGEDESPPHAGLVIHTSPDQFPCRMARLAHLRDQVRDFVFKQGQIPDLVVIESYSFGARNGREYSGELGGTIRLLIHTLAPTLPIIEVPPSTLKSYVTGKGHADKNVMLREVFRKWNYEATDDDDADSYALARFGLEWLDTEHTKAFEGYMQKVSLLSVETRKPKAPKVKKPREPRKPRKPRKAKTP